MLRIILVITAFWVASVNSQSLTYSKKEVFIKKTRDKGGLIISIRSIYEGLLLCGIRYKTDEIRMLISSKEKNRRLLIPNAKFHEPSIYCKKYIGNKKPGAIWRIDKYEKGFPKKKKEIQVY